MTDRDGIDNRELLDALPAAREAARRMDLLEIMSAMPTPRDIAREIVEKHAAFIKSIAADALLDDFTSALEAQEKTIAELREKLSVFTQPVSGFPGVEADQRTPVARPMVPEARSGHSPICPHCGCDEGFDDWWHCWQKDTAPLQGQIECGCGQTFRIISYYPGDVTSEPLSAAPSPEASHAD